MGDQPGANAKFAAPQDDGAPTPSDHLDAAAFSAALKRWVQRHGDRSATVPAQRSEMSCTG